MLKRGLERNQAVILCDRWYETIRIAMKRCRIGFGDGSESYLLLPDAAMRHPHDAGLCATRDRAAEAISDIGDKQRMFGRHKDPHSSIYLLADHLDSLLAIGEDLLALRLDLSAACLATTADDFAKTHAAIASFIQDTSSFEISLAAHLRQARLHARQLVQADKRFASLIRLFLGGTAALDEALAVYAAPYAVNFDHGRDAIAYLRARALIGEEAAGLSNATLLQPHEGMMIAGKIELGPLMDLVSAFLNSLDLAYDLYPEDFHDSSAADRPAAVAAPVPVPDLAPAATATATAAKRTSLASALAKLENATAE